MDCINLNVDNCYVRVLKYIYIYIGMFTYYYLYNDDLYTYIGT